MRIFDARHTEAQAALGRGVEGKAGMSRVETGAETRRVGHKGRAQNKVVQQSVALDINNLPSMMQQWIGAGVDTHILPSVTYTYP